MNTYRQQIRKIHHQFGSLLFVILSVCFSPSAYTAEDEQLTLTFNDTDITAVINAVSTLTGKNFIIDPRVKGKVTVITHQSMSKDEVYQVFLSVLKVHGFAAIQGKNVTKIVPEVSAKQDSIRTIIRANANDGDELVTQVIQIKYVNAAQLVPILRPLIPQRGHLAAYTASNVLIISDSAANVARLNRIIRRIDQSTNQEVDVIPLENATASEVVRVIKQLKKPSKDASGYTLVADDRTNSVLLSGEKQERVRLRALITHMDIPLELGGDTHVIYLKYAKAKDLAKVLSGVVTNLAKSKKGKAKAAPSSGSKSFIQADENTNALVINASAGLMRSLRNVVSQLDIRRSQVLVETIIAEVSYSKQSELGVEWALDGTAGGTKTGPVGVLNFGNLVGLIADPPVIGSGLSFGLGTVTNGNPEFGLLLRALAGDTDSNILATPSLVMLDNEEGKIVVAQTVPFVTGSYTGLGGGGATPTNPFQTVSREDVGLTLEITPQINEGDTIKLELNQEVSVPTDNSIGANIVTKKRSWNTTVLVDDGDVLVIGGLIDETLTESEQKIPGLGDIPLVGWLFKSQTTKKIKTNLMAFIHPTILKNKALNNRYTGRKYNYLRQKEQEVRERGINLLSDNEIPLLPEYEPVPNLPPRYESAGNAHPMLEPPSLLLSPGE
jgi:general secretion pathway protein D